MSHSEALLVNKQGPLPISIQYTPKANIEETIAFSGSLYTGDLARVTIGFEVKINGKHIGKSVIHTTDTNGSHHATVATMVNYDIPTVIVDLKIQPVTIELVALDYDSLSNKDDYFNLTIFI